MDCLQESKWIFDQYEALAMIGDVEDVLSWVNVRSVPAYEENIAQMLVLQDENCIWNERIVGRILYYCVGTKEIIVKTSFTCLRLIQEKFTIMNEALQNKNLRRFEV